MSGSSAISVLIDGALRTLDAGEGRELNIHEVLSRALA
jgi:hypothetical protein